ncbi:MAG: hypothetical protein AAGF12_29830 [Myxococcota bacterium]
MTADDPGRFKDLPGVGDDLRGALKEAQADLPSAEALAAVTAAVTAGIASSASAASAGAAGGASGLASGGAAAAGGGSSLALLAKIAVGTVVVGSAAVGVWYVAEDASTPNAETEVAVAADPRSEEVPVEEPTDSVSDIIPAPSEIEPATEVSEMMFRDEGALDEPEGVRPLREERRRDAEGRRSRQGGTSSLTTGATVAAEDEEGEDDEPVEEPAQPSESELLEQARAALQSRPGRALGLVRQHAELYPRGALSQEREVIYIEALIRMGNRDAARARIDRFRARHPSSIHLRRLEASLER